MDHCGGFTSRENPVWNPAWKTDSRLLVYVCSFFGAVNDRSFSFVSSNRYFTEVCQTYPSITIITSPTEIKTYYDMLQLLKPESHLSPGGSALQESESHHHWWQLGCKCITGGQDRVGLGWRLNKYKDNSDRPKPTYQYGFHAVGKLSANWWRPITMQCEEVENEGSLFQLRWSFEPCRTHLWSICAFLNGLSFLGWPLASWFNSLVVCTVNIYIILYWILLDMKYMKIEFMSLIISW